MKQKSELISRLEEKSTAMADTLKRLDDKYVWPGKNTLALKGSTRKVLREKVPLRKVLPLA